VHKKGGGATPLTTARKSPTLQTEPRNFTVMKKYKQLLGKGGEDLAVDFLKKNGFEILERNYRYGHKEIDIIGKDKNTIVFIEVKTGRSKNFGSPQEWVNLKKQKNIIEVAQDYIQKNDCRNFDFRFDVVAIELERRNRKFKECFAIEHIKNAFMVG
jgi:putative endonuclease